MGKCEPMGRHEFMGRPEHMGRCNPRLGMRLWASTSRMAGMGR